MCTARPTYMQRRSRRERVGQGPADCTRAAALSASRRLWKRPSFQQSALLPQKRKMAGAVCHNKTQQAGGEKQREKNAPLTPAFLTHVLSRYANGEKIQVGGRISIFQYSKFIRSSEECSLSRLPGSGHLLDNQRRRDEARRHGVNMAPRRLLSYTDVFF
ncbi:hypothetical protein NHX12_029765 [Muraenolepis orangiensis]|uniref:Uncharacterized protein n=1 Tax=Muraenolepis orangiensis TaxID=630683 RepID=A0A9Q0IKE1_9TELE|nr:hypothetical protein NHX12_029765 [Muraenolepis orangiensis]